MYSIYTFPFSGAVSREGWGDSISDYLRSRDAKPAPGAETTAEGRARDRHHARWDAQGASERSRVGEQRAQGQSCRTGRKRRNFEDQLDESCWKRCRENSELGRKGE